jgi:hypothetical protein
MAEVDEQDLDGLLVLEPREMYDPCIVGVVQQFNTRFVVYSKKKVLEALVGDLGDIESALEWWGFNMVGGWLGPMTPGYLEDTEDG